MDFLLPPAVFASLALILDLALVTFAFFKRRVRWGRWLGGYLLWSAGLAAAAAAVAWASVGVKPGYALGLAILSVPVLAPVLLWQCLAGSLWVLLGALAAAAVLAFSPRPRAFRSRVLLGATLLALAFSFQQTAIRDQALSRAEARGLLVIELPDLVRNLRIWLGHRPGSRPHGVACLEARGFIWSYGHADWIEATTLPEVQAICDKVAQ